MLQKFAAREKFEFDNGAVGWRPGGPFDCLGPFAKVQNCPVTSCDGHEFTRKTVYATSYPNSYFSVPACTRVRGRYIGGYLTSDGANVRFVVFDCYLDRM